MKQFINYYYGITVTNYHKEKDIYIIESEKETFWLAPCYVELRQDDIYKINNLKGKFNEIILDFNGNIFEKYNGVNYYLFKPIKDYKKELCVFDLINNNIIISNYDSNVKNNNILSLWYRNIEMFVEKYKTFAKNNKLLINSFSYYNGLAEFACQYLNESLKINKIDKNLDVVTICRRRIYYPNYAINYYNPLNIISDFEVRDYAEYFKSYFFSDYDKEELLNELKSLFKIKKFGIYSYHLFFSRLLFPNYYFILLNEENDIEMEKKLSRILELNDKWLLFLKNVLNELSEYCEMIRVEWI